MQSRDVGFEKDQVIMTVINNPDKFSRIKSTLSNNAYVENVTASNWWGFTSNPNTYSYNYPGKDPDLDHLLTYQEVDKDYIETFEISIVDGSSFSEFNEQNVRNKFILNEAAIELFEIENPVGSPFTVNGRQGKIAGVMKDAHFRALGREIEPRLLLVVPRNYFHVFFRIKSIESASSFAYMKEAVESIEKDWKKVCPDIPFEYWFVDDLYQRSYRLECSVNDLFTVFAAMAIFISCLGLFGLSTFIIQQKTKEIGIRKSNGAQSPQIVGMFVESFIKYVFVAFVLAVPIATYFMNLWLSNYAYRTAFSWWIYILAFAIVLFIALSTVMWHSLQAARRNPVEALRYE